MKRNAIEGISEENGHDSAGNLLEEISQHPEFVV